MSSSSHSVAVITVTYNAVNFIASFLESLFAADTRHLELTAIVVDNGSTDGTVGLIRERFPAVTVIQNDENNYARALNLGIAGSESDFVAITNNDASVHANWLQGFLPVFAANPRAGAVQSKIFFEGQDRLNSVGVEEIEHFYFKDIGFDEKDSKRNDKPAKCEYITGGSMMLRRSCLDDVGIWDEEFIMFMEDVDYSARCRAKGWELWFAPESILYHQYHGSTSQELCEYFCNRNRFLFVAKHFPRELAASIPTSHFFRKGEFDLLYRSLLHAVRKMAACHDTETVEAVLQSLGDCLPEYIGEVSAYSFFLQLEVLLGLRKIRVGIYGDAEHFADEEQQYVAQMAAIMQERYDVTFICSSDIAFASYKEWFDRELPPRGIKMIQIPLLEECNRYTSNEATVLREKQNPFDSIARASLEYDIFVNGSNLSQVKPLAPNSWFVCHFPDHERGHYFQVEDYDQLIISGNDAGSLVKKRWSMEPTQKLYPPVNMYNAASSAQKKEQIILSACRFDMSGSKKQIELIRTFGQMCKEHPEKTVGWRLVLIGGSIPENTYLDEVRRAKETVGVSVEIMPNAQVQDIRDYYRRSSIFWHACGLDEEGPERVEHFGMTTVEAMQNYCVPVVVDGPGQREIVEHGASGFRFGDLEALKAHSLTLMDNPGIRLAMAQKAFARSHLFSLEVFREQLESLMDSTEAELLGCDVLPLARENLQMPGGD
jgi:GT2 family glycosyltransferase/glycosyltransferase involved in cell wall biosynthesis